MLNQVGFQGCYDVNEYGCRDDDQKTGMPAGKNEETIRRLACTMPFETVVYEAILSTVISLRRYTGIALCCAVL
jgi:hypothetical protein